jgi:hypothetical protein
MTREELLEEMAATALLEMSKVYKKICKSVTKTRKF